MANAKHTPAPWKWGEDWPEVEHIADADYEDELPKYADLGLVGADGQPIIPIRVDHHEFEWDTPLPPVPSAADRALIVASPDLFAALAEIVNFCDDPNGSDEGRESLALGLSRLLPAARAAVAKAEGREP